MRTTKQRRTITESVTRPGGPLRVDRDSRTIYGVKVLGLESSNGRRYTAESLRAAIPLYEGRSVNIDHPLNHLTGQLDATLPRSAHDRFGRLVRVHQ
jgi:hypothetical protein